MRGGLRTKVLMLNPSGSGFGYVHELCQALSARGCDVHLYTSPHWTRASRLLKVRYQVRVWFYRLTQHRSQRPGLVGKFWRVLRLLEHIVAMVRVLGVAHQYDVIHVQWLPVPVLDTIFLWLFARFRPIVYTVHDLYPHDSRKTLFLKFTCQVIYRIPKALVVHSQSTAEALVWEFGIDHRKVFLVAHGAFGYLKSLTNTPDIKQGGSTVLFFGNIRRNKGLDVLIKAMKIVVTKVPAKLLVVGIPRTSMEPYVRLINELDLASLVELRLGYVEEEELPRIFGTATLVVLPYRTIDQSGVAITATTFGKALVATNVGGLSELVSRARNGLLVPPDDPSALAEAIRLLLEDVALRRQFERNSQTFCETELRWEPIAGRTLEIYTQVQTRRRYRGAPCG